MKCLQVVILSVMLPQLEGGELYSERYRPQFHFSPEKGWIGDPNGLFRHRDNYHVFWWGHAVSRDLVRWRQLPYPMTGDDGSFKYFSGSVVVDQPNSSGFGDGERPPMVAVYTAHGRRDKVDDQRLSFSTDHRTFRYFKGSPVLPAHATGERDPDVFWHEPTKRWVMATVIPEQRQVRFHASEDLKSWTYLSSFGPLGARAENWEVPNLFELPVTGGGMKWVLLCGMGPNKAQHFTGHFDGVRFTPDRETMAYLKHGEGMGLDVLEDFENGIPEGWSGDLTAFQTPALEDSSGHFGDGVLSSTSGKSGRLVSPPFVIREKSLQFLLGGHGGARVNLLVDGNTVSGTIAPDTRKLRWAGWNVKEWLGKQARVEIVNSKTEGGIFIDHLSFSDVLMNTGREHAKWIDWGSDFYAVRAIRDVDRAGRVDGWIAWMGNWQYANQVPTSWGKGALSIPREIQLVGTPTGPEIRQTPIPALRNLRGTPVPVGPVEITGRIPLPGFTPSRNTYELEAEFAFEPDAGSFGLELCAGESQKVVLGFDPRVSNVFLDRRESGNVGFSPDFPVKNMAPLRVSAGRIKFHLFVDQSSIEVFVNDGEVVMTSLIFPNPDARGIHLFSQSGGSRLTGLKAWELKSIREVAE